MRLYSIYKLCKENIGALESGCIVTRYESGKWVLSANGWLQLKNALFNLYAISAFQEKIKEIYEAVPVIYGTTDKWEYAVKDTSISVSVTTLKNKVQGIIDVYESFGYEESEIGIDIKVPEGDLTDFVGNIKSLEFIFNQCPLLKSEDSEIKFNNVDVGSTWLTFFIIGGSAIILAKSIAALLDKAIVLKSHFTQTKMQEEQLRAMELGKEALEAAVNTFKTLNEKYMNDALNELEREDKPYKDGEERDKTKMTLEKLIDLLDKGVEIYSSASSPKEIQLLFPALETKKLISSEDIKLLTAKEDE